MMIVLGKGTFKARHSVISIRHRLCLVPLWQPNLCFCNQINPQSFFYLFALQRQNTFFWACRYNHRINQTYYTWECFNISTKWFFFVTKPSTGFFFNHSKTFSDMIANSVLIPNRHTHNLILLIALWWRRRPRYTYLGWVVELVKIIISFYLTRPQIFIVLLVRLSRTNKCLNLMFSNS